MLVNNVSGLYLEVYLLCKEIKLLIYNLGLDAKDPVCHRPDQLMIKSSPQK